MLPMATTLKPTRRRRLGPKIRRNHTHHLRVLLEPDALRGHIVVLEQAALVKQLHAAWRMDVELVRGGVADVADGQDAVADGVRGEVQRGAASAVFDDDDVRGGLVVDDLVVGWHVCGCGGTRVDVVWILVATVRRWRGVVLMLVWVRGASIRVVMMIRRVGERYGRKPVRHCCRKLGVNVKRRRCDGRQGKGREACLLVDS